MFLLDDTLSFTRIEQGSFENNPTIFDLTALYEPICMATSSRARLNNIKFNVEIQKNSQS
jgi:signal transduction histidine kinase